MNNQKMKDTARKMFKEYLVSKGHRKTPERFAILEEIYSKNGHFDIETLYISMKNKNYRVSRATLYNTIELLLDSKLVVKHQFGKNLAQFEKAYANEVHDHMIDTNTGQVMEFFDPRIQQIIEDTCRENNFILSHHSLYIYGEKLTSHPVKKIHSEDITSE